MVEQTHQSVEAVICRHMATLSKSEIAVAEWILANQNKVVSMSMGQVAAACGFSDTSVLRLCRRIGMQGFTDLKFRLVADQARETTSQRSSVSQPLPEGAGIAAALFDECMRGFKITLDNIGDSLDLATDIIENADNILVVGVGTSIPATLAAQEQLFLRGLRCRVQTDPYLQRMEVSLMKPPSAVFAISHSGASIDTVDLLAQAKEQGLPTICLTGMPGSPVTKHADVALASLSTEVRNEPVAGRVIQMALVSALARNYAARRPSEAFAAEQAAFKSVIGKTL
ncbi:MAG: MurR/RpiR family transcriptional regulator [Alphaproteobacteria bacterium]|nr:MurR/RpiR family transcriptional regulator [Alphaproteobacteria bacterium]